MSQMNVKYKLRRLILLSVFLSLTSVGAQERKIKSVDAKKIKKDYYSKFIEHVFWYPKELIDSKKISKGRIPEDMKKFKSVLRTVMKAQYLPSVKMIDANSVAVEDLRNHNDYILLEYKYNKRQISIQDGKALYINIFPDKDLKIEQTNLAKYVESIAFEVLNIPKGNKEIKGPYVTTARLDIGDSKCGDIHYEMSDFPYNFWFGSIHWWSDGRNTLFGIGKWQFDHGDDMRKWAHIPDEPRKFKKED